MDNQVTEKHNAERLKLQGFYEGAFGFADYKGLDSDCTEMYYCHPLNLEIEHHIGGVKFLNFFDFVVLP